ncbi:MAG: hypothetical protein A4E53_03204 [Pelotomaculum sp. PtaB.Bin104]|nr:MAG: hypothetical protein A4E53_03204 [Pelotomaculum sp. PtaB.Bin104]
MAGYVSLQGVKLYMFEAFGKTILIFGLVMVVIGGLMIFGGKLFGLGRLPGDIMIQRENFSFYFPVATSIILSILLTIILNVLARK